MLLELQVQLLNGAAPKVLRPEADVGCMALPSATDSLDTWPPCAPMGLLPDGESPWTRKPLRR